VDWSSVVHSPQYQQLPAAARLSAVKSLQTHVVRALFLGDDGPLATRGVTGRGLGEFAEVAAAVRAKVKRVEVSVDPAAASSGAAAGRGVVRGGAVDADTGTLRLVVGLENVRALAEAAGSAPVADEQEKKGKGKEGGGGGGGGGEKPVPVVGVACMVETALGLRDVRQAAAVARGAQRVSAGCAALGAVAVEVDWAAFVHSGPVAGDAFDYVAQVSVARWCICMVGVCACCTLAHAIVDSHCTRIHAFTYTLLPLPRVHAPTPPTRPSARTLAGGRRCCASGAYNRVW
jgi:hypothetical protein